MRTKFYPNIGYSECKEKSGATTVELKALVRKCIGGVWMVALAKVNVRYSNLYDGCNPYQDFTQFSKLVFLMLTTDNFNHQFTVRDHDQRSERERYANDLKSFGV